MSLLHTLQPSKHRLAEWLTPRRLRTWREYLTGYLMIGPAVTLIFIFGIFPVGFALFVSLHKWRLKRGDIIGMTNYTDAIGPLAYLLVFGLGVGLVVWALFRLWRIYKDFEGGSLRFWLLNLPGILLAAVGRTPPQPLGKKPSVKRVVQPSGCRNIAARPKMQNRPRMITLVIVTILPTVPVSEAP